MDESIFLGCDIGTGSCKVLACDASGKVIGQSQSFYQPTHAQPGYSEEDPAIIKNAFIQCMQQILPRLPSPPAGMGFSSCMHSLILVNDAGQPITPMLTWEDNRSHQIAGKLRNSEQGRQLYSRTGTPIHSMSPLCKIPWFRENQSDKFKKAAKFIGIKEYLWHWMFGVFEVDFSIASATGLFNITELNWDEEALAFCGIRVSQLSAPVNTLFSRQGLSKDFLMATGLPRELKCCIGASDGCMANAGSGIDGPDKAALTIGTSGAVRITTTKPIVDPESMIFNYLLDDKTFISGGPVNNGGNTLHLLFRMILGKDAPQEKDFDDLDEAVAAIPGGSEGVVCLPWFHGERAPVWDEKASGIWLGVTNEHSRYHLVRAAMEGVCFTLKKILENIEQLSGRITYLYAGGGFIRSHPWVQMLADITGKKIVIRDGADASALGAVIWVMKAMNGHFSPQSDQEDTIISPAETDQKAYKVRYRVFCKLYELNKELMHML